LSCIKKYVIILYAAVHASVTMTTSHNPQKTVAYIITYYTSYVYIELVWVIKDDIMIMDHCVVLNGRSMGMLGRRIVGVAGRVDECVE